MKLLFDENLPRMLVVRLAELYPESAHQAEEYFAKFSTAWIYDRTVF